MERVDTLTDPAEPETSAVTPPHQSPDRETPESPAPGPEAPESPGPADPQTPESPEYPGPGPESPSAPPSEDPEAPGAPNVPVDEADAPAATPEELAAAGIDLEQLSLETAQQPEPASGPSDDQLLAVLEAVIYVTDEPLSLDQITTALQQPRERVAQLLDRLTAEYARPNRGLTVREVAGGYKMGTKPEHHEAIRTFVKNLKPPFKLSLAALETLAVIAYKQPITAPEIMEVRGVQGAGVLKTLLDRKLITTAGRKNVVGKPILYKTTRDFLIQFGLKDLSELPTLKEFEELRRLAFSDSDEAVDAVPDEALGTSQEAADASAGPAQPDHAADAVEQQPEENSERQAAQQEG